MEIFDISQTLEEGIASWPGDPEFHRQQVLWISKGESSNVCAIQIGTHTGTHVDAPLHVADSGKDATGIPVQACIGPARVVDFTGKGCIRAADLLRMQWDGVERVLFRTSFGDSRKNVFDQNFVYLDAGASDFLGERGILLIGTDAPSVDPFESGDLPSHRALLGRGIVILENTWLGHVPPGDYNLVCLPLKMAGADGSPVRAILWRQ